MYRLLCSLLVVLGAAAGVRGQQPHAEAVALAWGDVQTLSAEDAAYTRYLWLSDPTAKERRRTWAAAAGLINGLSLSRRVVSPVLVLTDGTTRTFSEVGEQEWAHVALLRLNLLDYNQTADQWDRLGDPSLEPLFHVWLYVDGKWFKALAPWLVQPLGAKDSRPYEDALLGLVKATDYSRAPIIEARNFVWQTAIDFDRKAGYYSWLGVKDKKSFDKLVRLDASTVPLREAVSESGVATQARAIDRFGRGDGYWITYDQVNQRAQGKRNPLITLDRKEFQFDASEIFARLDNGWWAVGLFDKDGNLQQSAPDGVGYNHQSPSNDGKIHPIACFACHDNAAGNGGLKPFRPYFRNQFADPGPLALGAKKKFGRLAEEYLTPLESWADNDKRIYAAAVLQANGMQPHEYAAALVETFQSYDRSLTLDDAAREHGVTADVLVLSLQAALVKQGGLDTVNANWILPEARRSKIGRDQFAESFNAAQLALRGLNTWGETTRKQLRPWEGRR